jgi:hypothetical protein
MEQGFVLSMFPIPSGTGTYGQSNVTSAIGLLQLRMSSVSKKRASALISPEESSVSVPASGDVKKAKLDKAALSAADLLANERANCVSRALQLPTVPTEWAVQFPPPSDRTERRVAQVILGADSFESSASSAPSDPIPFNRDGYHSKIGWQQWAQPHTIVVRGQSIGALPFVSL